MGLTDTLPGMKPGSRIRNVVIGVVYAFVLFAIIGAVLGGGGSDASPAGADGEPTQTAAGTPSPTPTAASTPQPNIHDIGQSFTVGTGDYAVRYTVTDVLVQPRVGSDVVGTDADGIFLVVILQMENVGDESFDITDRHLRAVDEQNREFEADFEAAAYAEQDPRIDAEGISYEQLNPGLTVTRAVAFDVAPGGEYELKITPVGVLSGADDHVVPLGTAEE